MDKPEWAAAMKEFPDGRVWTLARDRYRRLRPDRGERWDQAELAVFKKLEPFGFRDAFRHLHGPEVPELSWEWQRWGGGYRLDHLIVSNEVTVSEMAYLHQGHSTYPMRLGHEWAGVVATVGEDVDEAWIGRRVTGDTMIGDGTCRRCRLPAR